MKKCTTFGEQKGTRYIQEKVYFGIIVFSCLSSTKLCLRFVLIFFDRDIKRLLSEFFRKQGWFHGHIEISTTLTFSCHWKTIAPFWLWKKIPKNTLLTQKSQNCTEKQIMLLKTTVKWLFSDIWCYLVIGCFDWKIGVFSTNSCRGFIVSLNIFAKELHHKCLTLFLIHHCQAYIL